MNEDALTVEAVKSGDRERYAELVRRYERMVYGITWSRLGQHDLCEEAAQETFVQGFRFLAALRDPQKYASWIARIARNVATSVARRRRKDLENERRWMIERGGEHDATESPTRDESLTDVLREALKNLPENQRESLVLFYLQERSIHECARSLAITEDAFKVRLHRARGILREEVQVRLERSLEDLRLAKGFADRVISALPGAPLACGAAGVAGATALVLTAILQLTPLFFLMGWFSRQLSANYRGAEDYRRIVLRRHLPRQFVMMFAASLCGILMYRHFGARTTNLVVGLFLFPATVKLYLFLRTNHSGFTWASAVGVTAMTLAFFAQALGWASYWAFLAAMLIFNIALWAGRKSLPTRGDYNLVLRASFDELGRDSEEVSNGGEATPQEMRRFARFLGDHFLITDFSVRKDECLLAMPPVAMQLWRTLWPWREFVLSSRILIRSDGTCRVTLSGNDWKELRAVSVERNLSRTVLETRTTEALEQAFARFRKGDETRALAILQPRTNAQLQVRPVHELGSVRVIYLAGIICAVIALLLCLLILRR